MTLTQAQDFLDESETLNAVLSDLSDADFRQQTQFKAWTIEDVLVHLHFWNSAADLSAQDEPAFKALMGRVLPAIATGGFRDFENGEVSERGTDLRAAWIDRVRDMAPRWQQMDPKTRLPWAGPSMSARSSMTARQMETWAHGFEVFDVLGLNRVESDRLRNIVVLGVNTFGWSHQVNDLPIPDTLPALHLTAPSGDVWQFGDDAGMISGSAVDFAAVVTQTRALADTDLSVTGDIATTWMTHAQCFAGPPVKPPKAGARYRISHG